jgi:H+-translocating NAD(P) transhydrogenase subunit alpha
MRIFVPKESFPGERRIALVPSAVSRLQKIGAKIGVEAGLGRAVNLADAAYESAGATIIGDRAGGFREAQMILRVRKPSAEEVSLLQSNSIQISLLDPFSEKDLVHELARAGVTAISMELIPRIAAAQKMDALSSQANLAGYSGVIAAAGAIDRVFPMMMTAAGTIKPLRLLVIGVGVAGLQAIATGRRLGATVEAFDTRPVVEEQVKSLGAKFVKVELGETGETAGGYAKALTPEQLEKQRAVLASHVAQADVVITAAQVFGKRAPVVLTTAMIQGMRPGSVVVDLAAETGGNVEGSKMGEQVEVHGVQVLAPANPAGQVAGNASETFSTNVSAFVEHFWKNGGMQIDLTDPILKACVVTHGGAIANEMIRQFYASP